MWWHFFTICSIFQIELKSLELLQKRCRRCSSLPVLPVMQLAIPPPPSTSPYLHDSSLFFEAAPFCFFLFIKRCSLLGLFGSTSAGLVVFPYSAIASVDRYQNKNTCAFTPSRQNSLFIEVSLLIEYNWAGIVFSLLLHEQEEKEVTDPTLYNSDCCWNTEPFNTYFRKQ